MPGGTDLSVQKDEIAKTFHGVRVDSRFRPRGFTVNGGRIVTIDVFRDPPRLQRLNLTVPIMMGREHGTEPKWKTLTEQALPAMVVDNNRKEEALAEAHSTACDLVVFLRKSGVGFDNWRSSVLTKTGSELSLRPTNSARCGNSPKSPRRASGSSRARLATPICLVQFEQRSDDNFAVRFRLPVDRDLRLQLTVHTVHFSRNSVMSGGIYGDRRRSGQ